MNELRNDLTDFEKNFIMPMIADILRFRTGIRNAITNNGIRKILFGKNVKTSDILVRRMIHEIRINDVVKRLIASQKGYYVSKDYEETVTYITSLQGRINEMSSVINALERQLYK